MSRAFELLRQIERDLSAAANGNAEPGSPLPPQVQRPQVHRERMRPRWESEEASRLVQQIFLRTQKPPGIVVFAGMDHGDGCSRICASVAETLANSTGRPVCLVEANLHTPSLSGFIGVRNHLGLSEALLGEGRILSFTQPIGSESLWLLSSGATASDSFSLRTSQKLEARLIELREEFDFVLIDAPPLTHNTDALALGRLSDGFVLILETDTTRNDAASVAVANLRSANVPILAAILNKGTSPSFPESAAHATNSHGRVGPAVAPSNNPLTWR